MADWSDLQCDMLEVVAQRLTKIEDYVNFGDGCTSWRAAASNKNNFKGIRLWQQIPSLLLSPEDDKNDDGDREFYSLMDNEIVAKFSLPQIKGKKCLESLGWLVTIGEQGDMSLFNPFTGAEIPLPHQNTFPRYDLHQTEPDLFVRKAVLSSRPDESSDDFVLMVICGDVGFLAFWRPGDPSWNKIDTRKSAYCDVIFYNGQFYGVDHQGYVVVWDIKGPNPSEAKIITRFCNIETVTAQINELVIWKNVYLVAPQPQLSSSSSSEEKEKLLIVTRNGCLPVFVEDDLSPNYVDEDGVNFRIIYGATEFQVYELDLVRKTWKVIKNLGNTAIFVGHSASISIQVSSKLAPKIKPNHIYFTDDSWDAYWHIPEGGGKDMGVYSMETGSIVPFYHGSERRSHVCPSFWITTRF